MMASDINYDDPEIEEAWCDEQREKVRQYLIGQGVKHGEIGDWPAYHFAPYLSIFAIESGVAPGKMGWWVLSGDFPTDYFTFSSEVDHPRQVLFAAADRWEALVSNVRNGIADTVSIRGIDSNPDLQQALINRAKSFREIAGDQDIWDAFDEERAEMENL